MTAVQIEPETRRDTPIDPGARIAADGKFLRLGADRFLVKGVTYGTFAPDAQGCQFPSPQRVAEDFRRGWRHVWDSVPGGRGVYRGLDARGGAEEGTTAESFLDGVRPASP